MDSANLIVAVLGSLVGGVVVKLSDVLLAHRRHAVEAEQADRKAKLEEMKAKQAARHSNEEFLSNRSRELIELLQKKIDGLEGKLDGLREEHVSCRMENAELKARLSLQEQQNADLRARIGALEQKLALPEGADHEGPS